MIRSIIAVLLGLLLSANVQTLAQPARHLTVLHINDSHSNLVPGGPRDMLNQGLVGGIARVATVINRERLNDQPLLTLHAGDVFMGDPMFNLLADQPLELSLLAALGIDAMAVGNHEFDLGPGNLQTALSNTLSTPPAFPLLSANLDLSGFPTLNQYIQPATIKQYPGIKVGIFGLTTPAANYLSQPSPVSIIEDPTVLMPLIFGQVTYLRGAGCDIVICLSHMGIELDKVIAANIPGIDVIIGGHDHWPLAQPLVIQDPAGHPVSIVQTAGQNKQIGKLHMKLHKGVVSILNYHLINLDSSVPEDPTIKAMVDGAASMLEVYVPGLFSQPVAFCTGTLTEEAFGLTQPGYHDTHVGNLVTDAYRAATGADIAVQAGGSTAQTLYAGPLLPVDIFRMIGYGMSMQATNYYLGYAVATVDVDGANLWYALEATLADLDNDEMLMQVSSNMSYTYDPTKPVGGRVQTIEIDGAPIDFNATYTIACNEIVPIYLSMLGVSFSNVTYSTLTEFEVMTDYIMTLGTVGPGPLPGRVRAVIVPKRSEEVQPVAMSITTAPNPFSTDVVINVALSDETELTLFVVDVLGRKVATLGEGRFNAGMVTKSLHADALQSGVYFVVARTGDGNVMTSRILKAR